MTEQENSLGELWGQTSIGKWTAQTAPNGEGNPEFPFIVMNEDPVENWAHFPIAVELTRKDAEFIAAAHEAIPSMLKRLEQLEKDLEDARIWQARFANDSEAYKQGVEDMMEGLVRYLNLLKGTVYNDKEVHLIEVILHQYRK